MKPERLFLAASVLYVPKFSTMPAITEMQRRHFASVIRNFLYYMENKFPRNSQAFFGLVLSLFKTQNLLLLISIGWICILILLNYLILLLSPSAASNPEMKNNLKNTPSFSFQYSHKRHV